MGGGGGLVGASWFGHKENKAAIPDTIEYKGVYYSVLSLDSMECCVVGARPGDNVQLSQEVPYADMVFKTVAIGKKAFYRSPITSVHIPDGVREIGEGAFKYCNNLTSVHMPNSVERIGTCCFDSVGKMKELTLSSNLKVIPRTSFTNCKSLKTLTIPEGIVQIEMDAFALCDSLENVQLPSTLHTLERGVFWRCHELREFKIPATLYTLGEYLFFDCDSLKHLYNYATTPQQIPVISNNRQLQVHVPKSAEHLYKKAHVWRNYRIIGDL